MLLLGIITDTEQCVIAVPELKVHLIKSTQPLLIVFPSLVLAVS